MRYGIVGSRRRVDRQSVIDFIATLAPGDVVISGGCPGVDSWAVEAAIERGLETLVFLPDTTGCRQRFQFAEAYYQRNRKITEACDVLVAFVTLDRRGGTENTIRHARRLGKHILILPAPEAVDPAHLASTH